jgi:Fic family protein
MTQARFIWQRPEWPRFAVREAELAAPLRDARVAQGRVTGKAQALGLEGVGSAVGEIWAAEALATAAIEGERLELAAVRSSVARRLGLPAPAKARHARDVEGLLDMMQDAVARHSAPLTRERLFAWQAALFPTGRSGLAKIRTGGWRTGAEPMRIVSGPVGSEKVHYEAPPARAVARLMGEFLRWFGDPAEEGTDALTRTAIAHLWFETVHPFEDGNGRVGRAIVDLALAREAGTSVPLFRMSSRLSANRKRYYEELERAQRGTLDATGWARWFIGEFAAACRESEETIDRSLVKARFWARLTDVPLSDRQRKVVNVLLDAGPGGFVGGLSAGKYQHLTSTSRQTASRDLADLVEKGLLQVTGQLKGTRYHVAVAEWRRGSGLEKEESHG